jgi:drug/metabolite transporter (DMT)-like permease
MAAPLISPSALTVARFGLAGAAVGATGLMTGGMPAHSWAAPWRYGVLGGLLALYFVLMFEGLRTAAPVSTAAVFTLTPVMAAGFGWLLLRQITTARIALALALGGAGALWVVFRGDLQAVFGLQVGRGEVTYFFGCVAHAIYAPMVRRLNRGERAVTFTFGTMAAGFVLLCLWGWRDVLATDWAHLPSIVWICLAYTAFAASSITFVLLQFASLRLPSSKVMAYTYLVPAWVILWELALGHVAPPGRVLVGVALTVLALALLLKEDRPA